MENLLSTNNIGLMLDVAGVIIIFFFGISSDLNKNGAVGWLVENSEEMSKKAERHNRVSKLGLLLIIVGFTLQIIGNINK